MWKTRVRGDETWNKSWDTETAEEAAELAAQEANRASSQIDDDQDIEVMRADLPNPPTLIFSVAADVQVVYTARTFNSPRDSVAPRKRQTLKTIDKETVAAAVAERNPPEEFEKIPPDEHLFSATDSESSKASPDGDGSEKTADHSQGKSGKKGRGAETSKASATDFISDKTGR